ncbi:hypothetical protein [Pyrobaculum neutrophilum]|uniref:Uncharacterized protein n=1 Tax=Pyrobaculum neutrophilum (strain DSM 2338 / JCM 9278 / NBRC 100436 / V24Sta) TaxID=444157 RepID=B1YC62_PYRNV|nr:hypothetical protein [Pyrobaculum neutrophilum]ACB40916.1 conserved hypothetical protein [Pyrobaculum neutrophilum V24Sta]
MKSVVEEKMKNLSKLRVYMLVESTGPDISGEIGSFFSEALIRPMEVRAGGLHIAVTFLWSLLNRVAKQLEEAGEQVVDMEFGRGKTTILTKSGYVINILVKVRQNQYVSEIEGVVDVEESPFKIEDF